MLFCVSRCWRISPDCQTFCTVSVPGIQSLVLLGHIGTRVIANNPRRRCRHMCVGGIGRASRVLAGRRGCNRACRVVRGISNAYAWKCAVRGKQSPGSPDMPMQACVYSGMHWPADSKRSYGSAAQSVWLCTDRIRNLMERQYRWTAVPICRFLQTGCVGGLSGVASLWGVGPSHVRCRTCLFTDGFCG